jgi:hypothetical protein
LLSPADSKLRQIRKQKTKQNKTKQKTTNQSNLTSLVHSSKSAKSSNQGAQIPAQLFFVLIKKKKKKKKKKKLQSHLDGSHNLATMQRQQRNCLHNWNYPTFHTLSLKAGG